MSFQDIHLIGQDEDQSTSRKEYFMSKTIKFSDAQWEFLAVMNLFSSPISIDVLATLSPLSPSELLDLLERGSEFRILKEVESRSYSIEKDIPLNLKKRIEKYHTTENVSHLLQQIESLNLLNRLSPSTYSNLLSQSGKDNEAAQIIIQSAMEELEKGYPERAHNYLKQALLKLSNNLEIAKYRKIFIDAALDFSKLCMLLGIDYIDSKKFLEQVKTSSEIMGNKRAWALSNLHLGFFYFFLGKRSKALELFSIGKAAVDDLGDRDILIESSELIGIYFFLQGNYMQVINTIEQAESNARTTGNILNFLSVGIKFHSLLYLGDYYSAVGYIKSQWRNRLQSGQHVAANRWQVLLGISFVYINQYEKASFRLNSALKQANKAGYIQLQYTAKAGLAFLNYRKKNYKQAYLMMIEMSEIGKKYGMSESFFSPWILEMLIDFEKLGYAQIPEMDPEAHLQRIMKEPSRHLQGVALRLMAMRAFSEGKEDQIVYLNLKKSEELLMEVGDPVQLAKTRLEMAVLKLKKGENKEAYTLASEARNVLTEYGEDFFPDVLYPLLEEHAMFEKSDQTREEADEAFYAMISELPLAPNFEQGLEKLMMTCNRFFGAEQGAIFWSDDGGANNLYLRTPYNISSIYKRSKRFAHNMRIVKQSLERKQSIREHEKIISGHKKNHIQGGSIICLPFQTNKGTAGVIFHENSYIENCFSWLNENQLTKICDYLSNYISNIYEFSLQIELAKDNSLKKAAQIDNFSKQQFIIRGAAMTQVINQTRVIAETDGTVLILGETGVGKELLARWIHNNSMRRNWPIVTIDSTTIPDTLIESELFGYEKGSFTGADQRKIGQVELADKGTLFIDEIGEIPLNTQVKLLRLLQEKKFRRIGGHRVIESDFRLIAATNRNLIQEVDDGRFRNDLYYRLNVFPITIPPLRHRKDEIIYIAEEFINRYGKIYNRHNLSLSQEHRRQLTEYEWPGNIRELENIIERSVLMSTNSNLDLLLPLGNAKKDNHLFADKPTLEDLQRRYILHILEENGGKVSGQGGATEILGIKRTTLIARMKKLGIV